MPLTTLVAIVDDDSGIRSAVSSLLRSAGFAVRLYATAEAFLSDAQEHLPACVLSDVQMPGMNGLELQEALLVRGINIPILFMTAYSEKHMREQALARGALCFLSKPFDAETLLEALYTVVVQDGHG